MSSTAKDRTLPDLHWGDEAWKGGVCGSRDLMLADTPDSEGAHAICMECQGIQEVDHRSWPLTVLCNIGAFRKGSPERAESYRWACIMDTLKEEHPFHCQKGLPMSPPDAKGPVSFEAPDASMVCARICADWFDTLAKVSHRTAFVGSTEDARSWPTRSPIPSLLRPIAGSVPMRPSDKCAWMTRWGTSDSGSPIASQLMSLRRTKHARHQHRKT